MPAQQRVRTDQVQGLPPAARQSRQYEQEKTVVTVEPRALDAATQHDDLLTNYKAFSTSSSERVRVRSRDAPTVKIATERAGRSKRWSAWPKATNRAAIGFKST